MMNGWNTWCKEKDPAKGATKSRSGDMIETETFN